MPKLLLILFTTALLTTGCAAPLLPGATRDEAIARYGKPSRIVPLPAGTRLQYSGQPASQTALMVDLDAAGRVVSMREAMGPEGFARVIVDQSTRADVERELGPPALIERVRAWDGDIMTYRWRDAGFDMYFSSYLDSSGVVRRKGQGMEMKSKAYDD